MSLEQQHEASDPGVSVWVDASAGAGKTKILKEPSLESTEKIKNPKKENEENLRELDILSKEDDKVLEIPAFLRRQVN